MIMKDLSEVTDQECYEIAVLDGWEDLWEHDRGGRGTVPKEKVICRGREIVDGEIKEPWVNINRVNGYLIEHGYECLKE